MSETKKKYIKICSVTALVTILISAAVIFFIHNSREADKTAEPSASPTMQSAEPTEESTIVMNEHRSAENIHLPSEKAKESAAPAQATAAPAASIGLTEHITMTPAPKADKETELKKTVCSIAIKCDTAIKNSEKLNPEKKDIVPENGVILNAPEVSFAEGKSLFEILQKTLSDKKIHMDYEKNPISGVVYIKGIGNIYEGDCGSMSGWMYTVNGEYPSASCDEYIVKNGDKIEFTYVQ